MIIKQVGAEALAQYSTHLKHLTPEDRFTRFGYSAKDFHIDQFILTTLYSFADHAIFVAYDIDGNDCGYCHLVRFKPDEWELAVSVNSSMQNQGIGDRLMSHSLSYAKMHGVPSIFMHCINENKKIQHLARKHGLKVVERDGTDITAKLEIPEPTVMEYTADFLRRQIDVYSRMISLHKEWLNNMPGR